jgi:hypothetical protein
LRIISIAPTAHAFDTTSVGEKQSIRVESVGGTQAVELLYHLSIELQAKKHQQPNQGLLLRADMRSSEGRLARVGHIGKGVSDPETAGSSDERGRRLSANHREPGRGVQAGIRALAPPGCDRERRYYVWVLGERQELSYP